MGGQCRKNATTPLCPNRNNDCSKYDCNYGFICCYSPWDGNFIDLRCRDYNEFASNTIYPGTYQSRAK